MAFSVSLALMPTRDDALVIIVGSDEEPEQRLAFHQAERTVPGADSHRVERMSHAVQPLEIQAGVTGVGLEELKRESGLLANVWRQARVTFPEAPMRS